MHTTIQYNTSIHQIKPTARGWQNLFFLAHLRMPIRYCTLLLTNLTSQLQYLRQHFSWFLLLKALLSLFPSTKQAWINCSTPPTVGDTWLCPLLWSWYMIMPTNMKFIVTICLLGQLSHFPNYGRKKKLCFFTGLISPILVGENHQSRNTSRSKNTVAKKMKRVWTSQISLVDLLCR